MNEEFESVTTPDEFNEFVDSVPRKVNLRDYSAGIHALRRKGYSFAEIAEMASGKLGVKITRSQVAYILTTPPDVLADEEEAERMEAEEEAAEEFGGPSPLGMPRHRADEPPGGEGAP